MGETRGGGGNKKPSSKNNGRKFRSRGKKSGKSLSEDEGETEHLGEESTKRRVFSCTPCTNLKKVHFFHCDAALCRVQVGNVVFKLGQDWRLTQCQWRALFIQNSTPFTFANEKRNNVKLNHCFFY